MLGLNHEGREHRRGTGALRGPARWGAASRGQCFKLGLVKRERKQDYVQRPMGESGNQHLGQRLEQFKAQPRVPSLKLW
jgi:hypothetical protein